MPEQMAFARKASGLVRGLSLIDAFGVGFMNHCYIAFCPVVWSGFLTCVGYSWWIDASLRW
jgi:hypothetical protein